MGGASHFTAERQFQAKNTKTGKAVTVQVWREPPQPGQLSGAETLELAGGGSLRRIAQGRYVDLGGTEYASDDPAAP